MNRPLALCALALTLAGCGQKGPLYLPGNEQARERYDPQNEYHYQQSDNDSMNQQDNDNADNNDSDDNAFDNDTSRQQPGTPPGTRMTRPPTSTTQTGPYNSGALDNHDTSAHDIGDQADVPNASSESGTTTNPVGGPATGNQ